MSLWKLLQAALIRLGIAGLIIAFIAGIVAAAYFAAVFPDWTGFGPPLLDPQGKELPRAKTLWDWLSLLLVPVVLAIGGYFLTRSENRYALQLQERREQEARKLETERAQDAALQSYLDQMTQLLLHDKVPLRISQPGDEVRSVARARTLAVLRVLDGVRKGAVVQFLYEAGLIGGVKKERGVVETIEAIVSLNEANLRAASLRDTYLGGANLNAANLVQAELNGANLELAELNEANLEVARLTGACLNGAHLTGACLNGAYLIVAKLTGADLTRADLIGADLREAKLTGADLTKADLTIADLTGTNLREADLTGANLREANLTDCKVTREQLVQAASLKGAKLPFDMTPPPAPKAKVAAPQNSQPQQPAPEVKVPAQEDKAPKKKPVVKP